MPFLTIEDEEKYDNFMHFKQKQNLEKRAQSNKKKRPPVGVILSPRDKEKLLKPDYKHLIKPIPNSVRFKH